MSGLRKPEKIKAHRPCQEDHNSDVCLEVQSCSGNQAQPRCLAIIDQKLPLLHISHEQSPGQQQLPVGAQHHQTAELARLQRLYEKRQALIGELQKRLETADAALDAAQAGQRSALGALLEPDSASLDPIGGVVSHMVAPSDALLDYSDVAAPPVDPRDTGADELEGELEILNQELLATLPPRAFLVDQADVTDGTLLGRGSFGSVRSATVTIRGSEREVAIKSAHAGPDCQYSLAWEALCMTHFSHRNIISMSGLVVDAQRRILGLAMPRLQGTLRDLIRDYSAIGREFSLAAIGSVAAQIARGLAYIHTHDAAHCDVKTANILIESAEDMTVVVGDLGMVTYKQDTGYLPSDAMYSSGYRAPEVTLSPTQVDESADIFALGRVLMTMITGEEPYDVLKGMREQQLLARTGSLMLPLPETTHPDLRRLIKMCVAAEPSERCTAKQVVLYAYKYLM